MGRGRVMSKTKAILLGAAMSVIAGWAVADGNETSALSAPFTHERRAALATDAWGWMRADWSAVADWPVGDSPVAKAVRKWIGERLSFNGDTADWDSMTHFCGKEFLAGNGPKCIEEYWRREESGESLEPCVGKPKTDPGADIFLDGSSRWFRRHTATVEYEDERIVSYRSGLYGFYVGNSTSAAYVKCATFRKHDGKILGWDAFADTNVVFGLVRELARIQFKEGADYAGLGVVPVPDAPLFTKDGFWTFWGDYMIIHGHVYELNGAFPSLFVPWRDSTCGGRLPGNREAIENLLTQEAKADLGVGIH